ncbi:MAG: formylglycine-generating enzyme family protein [Bryobacteraceae bacterium]|jgi:formylglycine-generating enzyme required for sulfatase activity
MSAEFVSILMLLSLPVLTGAQQPQAASKQETAVARRAGETRVNPKDGLTYVWIPPGKFLMGCSAGDTECAPHEQPAHEVTISQGFWLSRTPVTQQAYQRVTGKNPSFFKGPQRPVEMVNWNEAKAYCAAAGGRLPTEAEWEYAARAGSMGARYGNLDDIAWHYDNAGFKTHEVAQKRANAFGLYDMLGDVFEWVADWYGDYSAGEQTDPTGPASGQLRMVRGGSWDNVAKIARVSYRGTSAPGDRNYNFGIRCVGE